MTTVTAQEHSSNDQHSTSRLCVAYAAAIRYLCNHIAPFIVLTHAPLHTKQNQVQATLICRSIC